MASKSLEFNDILLYTDANGKVKIDVIYEEDTFWLSQKKMAELFAVSVPTINEHLQNIFKSNELTETATIRKFRIVQREGKRDVKREIDFYNLDAIIAVGYRVNSHSATQFRIWATATLKEFIIKGFVLDDERLKQGKRFGKDYFDELLERIREIRTQEVYDFFLFIKQRYGKQTDQDKSETIAFSNHSANTIEEWRDDKEDDVWK
ncbi:MAG: virulence RhuM family protein [Methylococcaceae bacterium]|nr:virulence RhuM family protein [Methylococcaceae bacterium]